MSSRDDDRWNGDADGHLTEELLERLWKQEELDQLPELGAHLLAGCRKCLSTLEPWFFPPEPAEPAISGKRVRDWAVRQAERRRREREDAPQVLQRLEGLPPGRQALVLKSSRRFRTPAVVDTLIEAGNAELSSDIDRAVRFMELAVTAADALEGGALDPQLALDYGARARVGLARSRRRFGDLRGAELALRMARNLLVRGTGDHLELARLLNDEALLRRSQGRKEQALEAVAEASELYRYAGDEHEVGRMYLVKADVLDHFGEQELALVALSEAARRIDPKRRPRSVLTLAHNLAMTLIELGHTEEAKLVLRRNRDLYATLGRPVDLLRGLWILGSLLLEQGRAEEAAQVLAEVRTAMAEHNLAFESASVSLELALALAKLGKSESARRVVLQAMPVFRSCEASQEFFAALSCLRRTAE